MHTNFSKIALLYPKGDTRPSHEDLPKCAKLGVEIHIYTNIDTRTHTPQHFLKWNYISSYTKKYIYCMRCFSLLFDDTCFSIMLLKDKKKKIIQEAFVTKNQRLVAELYYFQKSY